MEPLNVGDVVQLKSGGPAMTVSTVQPGQEITCHWFNEGELKVGHFNIHILTGVESEHSKKSETSHTQRKAGAPKHGR